MIKKLLATLALSAATAVPVMADPILPSQYKTAHSMGCMILLECTDNVKELRSIVDISEAFPNSVYLHHQEELASLFDSFDKLGIKVYLGDQLYFPRNHRGVYSTVENNMYLNASYMDDPEALIEVLRHEGWHAAQDIMAGSIDNSQIAIIMLPELIPPRYVLTTDIAYAGNPAVLPWEREAKWAGYTPWMTAKALEAATKGPLWEAYSPTPKTREWLMNMGYIKK